MEEKLDEIITLLTQLPDTLHSFMSSKGEDETEPPEDETEPPEDETEQPEDEQEQTKEKDLGMDYLDF